MKVRKVEARLEEISFIASQFKDNTQNLLEIFYGILTWLETTKEPAANEPVKDSEKIHLEYKLMGFGNKVAEKLLEVVKKTKYQCMEFCEKVLETHKRCQISSKKRLDGLLAHEEHLKQLHDRLQEDELGIQLIKNLDDKVLKSLISQAAVNNCRLEYQLRLLLARMNNIKAQASKHEVTVKFLEPSCFEEIVTDAMS